MDTPKIRFPGFVKNWEKSNVSELVEIRKSYSYSRNEESEYGMVSHIHYGDIHSKFNNIIDNNSKLPFLKLIEIKDLVLLEKGDIILADASEDYNGLGTTIVNLSDRKDIIGGLHTFVLRPDKEKLYSLYFLNYSKTLIYKKYMQKIGTGASVFGISKANLEKLALLKPSLEEQQKIGDFFMLLDKRIEQQEEKIALLKDYKKTMMQKIFSQKIRFKDENGNDYPDWEEKKLGEISNIQTGNMNVEDNIPDGKYYFFDRSVTIKKLNSFTFDNEAIIYPGEGSEFLPRYFNGKYALHQRSYSVNSVKDNSIKYIYHFLKTKNNHFLTTAVGSTVKSLRKNCFENCIISLPCLLEQEKIALFLTSIDKNIDENESILYKFKDQKQALLSKIFV